MSLLAFLLDQNFGVKTPFVAASKTVITRKFLKRRKVFAVGTYIPKVEEIALEISAAVKLNCGNQGALFYEQDNPYIQRASVKAGTADVLSSHFPCVESVRLKTLYSGLYRLENARLHSALI